MKKLVLITGGAGFIGSHLTDRLIEGGYQVRVFDNLDPQIHPEGKPEYLNPAAEFIQGDVRDRAAFAQALEGAEAVFHFAAAVGTGQSMYQIEKYSAVNLGGLANLLDILVETGARPRLIFAGSATSYGECAHSCPEHGLVFPDLRPAEQLEKKIWDLLCPTCRRPMVPAAIPEHQPLRPRFVYGLNKKAGEEMLQAVADTYQIPYTILRFFNVYGPRQSLSNPYTGVMAIFSSRIKNGHAPIVIEDGKESRDFVSVYDIVQANILTLENDKAVGQIFNVGTGQATEILPMAKLLLKLHGSSLEPEVNGEYRKSDFRHSIADISKIRSLLGYDPQVEFAQGMEELYQWSKNQTAIDRFQEAYQEMRQHGIITTRPPRPKVAVVTLNWNGYEMTVECVNALTKSIYDNLKIIVVDNGSRQQDGQRLVDHFGQAITVVQNTTNRGVAGGNNDGITAALADPDVQFIVMMNNDLMVEPQTIERLVAPAEVNQQIGMVAGRMMNYFHQEQIDNLGIALTTASLGYNRRSEWYPLFCPCSGLGLYRASAFRKLQEVLGKVWDDDFFAYVDEQDVGWHIRMLGYTAAYASQAVGYHKEGATSGGPISDFAIYHGHRNNLWFLVKNYSARLWWQYLPGILGTQLGTFLLYARRRRLKVIVRAKWDSVKGIGKMLAKRRAVQKLWAVQPSELERLLIPQAYIRPEAAPSLKE